MAYQDTHKQSSLGGTGASVMSSAAAAVAIVKDPYLGTVANLVLKLQKIESKADPSVSTGRGIGLRTVVGPLRAFVKMRENPWILPVVATSLIGVIFLGGYAVGRKK